MRTPKCAAAKLDLSLHYRSRNANQLQLDRQLIKRSRHPTNLSFISDGGIKSSQLQFHLGARQYPGFRCDRQSNAGEAAEAPHRQYPCDRQGWQDYPADHPKSSLKLCKMLPGELGALAKLGRIRPQVTEDARLFQSSLALAKLPAPAERLPEPKCTSKISRSSHFAFQINQIAPSIALR